MSTATQDEELLIIQDEGDDSDDTLSFNIDFDDDTSDSNSENTAISEVKSDNWTDDTFEIQLDDVAEDSQNDSQVSDTKIKDNDSTSNASQVEASPDTELGIIIEDMDSNIEIDSNIAWEDTVDKNSVDDEVWFEIPLWDDVWTSELKDEMNDIKEEASNNSSSEQGEVLNILWSAEVSEVSDSESWQAASSENLNDILTATIAKLALRKEAIQTDTSSKQAKVQDLKAEVEKLEWEISEIEAEITSLWLESEKIDMNITQLEDMKLDPVKEHNAKRVSKK